MKYSNLDYWAIAILLVGLVSAVVIFVYADDADSNAETTITAGRMYEHNLAVMGGKFAVYSVRLTQWVAQLFHGRTLAYTIAVVACAVAFICFWISRAASSSYRGDKRREN